MKPWNEFCQIKIVTALSQVKCVPFSMPVEFGRGFIRCQGQVPSDKICRASYPRQGLLRQASAGYNRRQSDSDFIKELEITFYFKCLRTSNFMHGFKILN